MRQPSVAEPHSSEADLAACAAMLRGGSRTFYLASLTLPAAVRAPAIGLYAFCRSADDAIDNGTDRMAALRDLRDRLDAIYAGRPQDHSADRALTDVVTRHCIPRSFLDALLEGFEWDSHGRRYSDLSALRSYAMRVAGTVGAMMALVMGVRRADLLARACDLGVAMQLTNIARDVGEDARLGRLYLPTEWLHEAGLDPDDWLRRPVFDERLRRVVQRLLVSADALYVRADAGLAELPAACRPGMYAARLLYAEIGHELARGGYDSVNRRAIVPAVRKGRLVGNALWLATRRARAAPVYEALDEAQFLLSAVAAEADVAVVSRAEGRVVWLLDLFEKLERRETLA
jgi:phytoene synthase